MKRWSTADRITFGSTVVVFVSLFLPWFGVSGLGYNVTVSGLSTHGYLYLVLFGAIAVVLYLLARAGWDQLPISVKLAHGPAILVATSFNLALVVIAFLLKPGGAGVGWEFGAFVALIAAVVAVAPIAIPAIQSRR